MEDPNFGADNVTNLTNLTCSRDSDDVSFAVSLLYRKIFGSIIFVVIWPFIAFDVQKHYPLSRPAAALVGATFMVMFLVIPIPQAFDVIGEQGNIQTICLLIGMMLLSYYYDREGLLRVIALWIFGNNKPFRHILWKVCVGSAVLSAIITNDATCIVLTPLILTEHIKQNRSKKEYAPLLIGIATSANIGSAATFFGNPQNAFIAANSKGEISLVTFFATGLPAAVLGMCLSLGMLYAIYFRVIFSKGEGVQAEAELAPDQVPVPDPQIVTDHGGSLALSREEFALSHDGSEHPHASSRIATERGRLYHLSPSASMTSVSIPKSQSRHSLPGRINYGTIETSLSIEGSSSNPNLGGYHSLNFDPSGVLGTTSPRTTSLPSTRPMSPPTAQNLGRYNSVERIGSSPLCDVPEDRTISMSHTDQDEEEEEVVETTNVLSRKWQSKVFIVWLLGITIVLVLLLAIPDSSKTNNVDFNLGLVPLGCAILTMLVDTTLNQKHAYDAMTKIDWPVILMFLGLFVWLQGFQNTNFPADTFKAIREYMDLSTVPGVILFTVFIAVGSNVLSNVPLVIVIIKQIDNFRCGDGTCSIRLVGVLLAWVSTIAGNFTLIGSIANLIVAEKARSCANYPLTFLQYLKFGLISTLVVLFAGLPIVYFAGDNITI